MNTAAQLSESLLLTVDVGNTKTSLGLFAGKTLQSVWSLTTPVHLTVDEAFGTLCDALPHLALRAYLDPEAMNIQDSILASVVPDVTAMWQKALYELCGRRTLTVGPGIKTGFPMRYRDPSEVGADRIADISAALEEYPQPTVVVDLGTTTTFEVLDAQGVFLGGIITPGMSLGARSLADAAAKLPIIEVQAPKHTIGTSTREAMRSGIVWGEVARIDGLLAKIAHEAGFDGEDASQFTCVITGNNASAVAALMEHDATADETLTLRGLAHLHTLNRRVRI